MHPRNRSTDEIRVVLISDPDALRALRDPLNQVADPVPFRRWEWIEACWCHFHNRRTTASRTEIEHELFVLAVYGSGGELLGAAPLFKQPTRSGRGILRWLGSDESCSDYLGIVARPDRREQVAIALADWLTTEGNSLWDRLELTGVDADDPNMIAWAAALRRAGAIVHQRPGINCWRLDLPDRWDDYLACLSKPHRKQVRRADKRLFATGRAKCHTVETERDLEYAFPILVDLHQRRRQSLGEPGLFSLPAYTEFQRDVAPRLLCQGMLQLHWLTVDDRVVAAEYNLANDSTIYSYQSGIDPEALDLNPGWLLQIATIRQAIDDGYARYDFLRGDEPYKQRWRATVRPSVETRVVPNRPMARIQFGIWAGRERAKQWIKTALGRQTQIATPAKSPAKSTDVATPDAATTPNEPEATQVPVGPLPPLDLDLVPPQQQTMQ